MNELFYMSESLSPRLRWMKRNHVTIIDDGEEVPTEKRFRAKHGMASVATGPDEITACINARLVINKGKDEKGWEG